VTATSDTGPELRDTGGPGRWLVSDVLAIGSGGSVQPGARARGERAGGGRAGQVPRKAAASPVSRARVRR
jgi:hypothetical protein